MNSYLYVEAGRGRCERNRPPLSLLEFISYKSARRNNYVLIANIVLRVPYGAKLFPSSSPYLPDKIMVRKRKSPN